MKIRSKSGENGEKAIKGAGKPKLNAHKRTLTTVAFSAVALLLIALVAVLASKAKSTVSVVMTSEKLYQKQQLKDIDKQFKKYDMLQAEYEKYTVLNRDGSTTRRLVLWDERKELLGYFMANPLGEERLLEYSDLVKSKIDNSDTVMYAYPGKDLTKLTIGTADLTAFKTYLKPGDRINVECSFSNVIKTADTTGEAGSGDTNVVWGTTGSSIDQFDSDDVFKNIQIADIQNSTGDSVLDLTMQYNDMNVFQQAQLDADKTYQKKLEPATLILALTPAEKIRYKKYLAKNGATFYISIPQRVE